MTLNALIPANSCYNVDSKRVVDMSEHLHVIIGKKFIVTKPLMVVVGY